MTRNLSLLLGALALACCGLSAPAQSSQSLVGTWSTTYEWNLPSGKMITTTFMANGNLESTLQSHQGMSFTLAGTYQFNAAQGTLSYKWQDYSPKQTCILGACTPAQPPAQMGVVITSSIRFLSATQFVATSNGASSTYVRTNAVGTPVP
jgi:hypothetical protein